MPVVELYTPKPRQVDIHPTALQVWHAIYKHLKANLFPPTVRDIALDVGTSNSNVKYHLDQLHAQGVIWRSGGARAICLLNLPPGREPILIDGRSVRKRRKRVS